MKTRHNFYSDFSRILEEFKLLQEILKPTHGFVGSYMMRAESFDFNYSSLDKIIALYCEASKASKILEVGSYAGHSLMLMLIANPHAEFISVDCCEFAHTEKCIVHLNERFDNRIQFVKGYSPGVLKEIPNLNQFDLVHLDGLHEYETVTREIEVLADKCHNGITVIFDDFDFAGVADAARGSQNIEMRYVTSGETQMGCGILRKS